MALCSPGAMQYAVTARLTMIGPHEIGSGPICAPAPR